MKVLALIALVLAATFAFVGPSSVAQAGPCNPNVQAC